jgi:hypothetical protein
VKVAALLEPELIGVGDRVRVGRTLAAEVSGDTVSTADWIRQGKDQEQRQREEAHQGKGRKTAVEDRLGRGGGVNVADGRGARWIAGKELRAAGAVRTGVGAA